MVPPLVSVVCLCYDHQQFVEEAILSVLNQTYPNIQLIVVDDASNDGSQKIIEAIAAKNKSIELLFLPDNQGNCRAFNLAFEKCNGEFIIDFAADDVLLPNRVARGVELLMDKGSDYGVQFGDAELIGKEGTKLGLHSDRFPSHSIPSGDVYMDVIFRYFICAPTMLIRRSVLEKLNGYDEELAYEDFDFWVRASRDFKFCYLPDALVKRRILSNSMRSDQFKKGSPQRHSTLLVCKKILILNRTQEEHKALLKRISYEIKVCLKLFDLKMLSDYYQLRKRVIRLL
ncbi:MAG: glycosyltransferase [Cyclobacteriaceae bacterium]